MFAGILPHDGNFYPRSPCGERRPPAPPKQKFYKISIHALLAESDPPRVLREPATRHFYPRSPCGERRDVIAEITEAQSISIHALLAESDGRHSVDCQAMQAFLSTLSLRRATWHIHGFLYGLPISIHALLAESDSSTPAVRSQFMHFYPRSPCGERPRGGFLVILII